MLQHRASQFDSQPLAIPLYQISGENACSCCGHRHWFIGRTTAECAHCSIALPLTHGAALPSLPGNDF